MPMQNKKLKPVADPTKVEYRRANKERAARVRAILEKNYHAKTEGNKTALMDLMADVRHFCDAR